MDYLSDVKKRFDALANNYNKKLETAKFFGHDHMVRVLNSFLRQKSIEKKLEILDIGCGTGLSGQAFKPYAAFIDGVDLSENMIAKSKSLGLYRHLYSNDILSHLRDVNGQYDLITASSVFLYFGELQTVFNLSFSALKPHGIFLFTCDKHDNSSVNFQTNPRNSLMFTHSQIYIENCIRSAGFNLGTLEKIDERLNWKDQAPVPAFVVLAWRDRS